MKKMLFYFLTFSACTCFSCGGGEKGGAVKSNSDTPKVALEPAKLSSETQSNNMDPKTASLSNLKEIFSLVEKGNFKDASSLICYRGTEALRKWKSACDYKNEIEKKQVDGICNKIRGFQNDMSKIEFGSFIQENESEGEWNIWEVTFYYNDGTDQTIKFAFLKVNQSEKIYLLGDIDG